MYSKHTGLILGFHGCDKSVRDKILNNRENNLKKSTNEYDWLGTGIYFWENDPKRAMQFAKETSKRNGSAIKESAVLGAVLDLGYCLDLMNTANISLLKEAHTTLIQVYENSNIDIPQNYNPKGHNSPFYLLRNLDCAVIETLHEVRKENNMSEFDSVRALFPEGEELYTNAGFRTKNHIQICVRNPNCIKGFFLPREIDTDWSTV